MAFGHARPLESWRCRHSLARAHVGPDDPSHLDRGVRLQMDLVAERLGLVHLVHTVAGNVVLPPVVDTAQARLLVASEPEGRATMRTEFVYQADAAGGIPKTYQTLAEELHSQRRAVRFGQLPREESGNPVSPHRLAHGGARCRPRDQLVLFTGQHFRALLVLGPAFAGHAQAIKPGVPAQFSHRDATWARSVQAMCRRGPSRVDRRSGSPPAGRPGTRSPPGGSGQACCSLLEGAGRAARP